MELYTRFFPASPELERELVGSLSNLFDDDLKVKRKAAAYIETQARNDWTTKRRNWLADPRTIERLIAALNDDDETLVKDVVLALGSISQRFEYLDCRATEALCDLYEKSGDALKIVITSSLPQYNTPQVWSLIQQTLDCLPSKEAIFAVGKAITYYAEIMEDDIKEKFVPLLLLALRAEKNIDAKEAVLNALANMKVEDAVVELNALMEGATKRLKAEIESTIARIESGEDEDDDDW